MWRVWPLSSLSELQTPKIPRFTTVTDSWFLLQFDVSPLHLLQSAQASNRRHTCGQSLLKEVTKPCKEWITATEVCWSLRKLRRRKFFNEVATLGYNARLQPLASSANGYPTPTELQWGRVIGGRWRSQATSPTKNHSKQKELKLDSSPEVWLSQPAFLATSKTNQRRGRSKGR